MYVAELSYQLDAFKGRKVTSTVEYFISVHARSDKVTGKVSQKLYHLRNVIFILSIRPRFFGVK